MLNDSTIMSLPNTLGLAIPLEGLVPVLVTTIVFVVLGLLVFVITFLVISKALPFSIRKELEDDHNVAIAIVIGSVILGTALIIAAAIHG